jgi:hydrogenase maturation protease
MTRALVVCVGNRLIGDDAVGPIVFDALLKSILSPSVRLCLLETRGIAVLDEFAAEDLLIVIDAVRFGAEAGTIHRMSREDLQAAARMPVTSHDIALADALSVCALLYPERMPKEVRFIGVEGENFNILGAPLSDAIEKAVPIVVEEVLGLLAVSDEVIDATRVHRQLLHL